MNRSNKRLGVLSLLVGILIFGLTGSRLANPLETDIGDTPYFLLDTRTLLETDTDETPSFTLDTRAPLVALHTTSQHGYILKEPDLELHEYGTTVTLSATPDTGFVFTGWSGDISSEDQQDNPLILTMDGDKTLTAIFVKVASKPAIWLISNLNKAGKRVRNEL